MCDVSLKLKMKATDTMAVATSFRALGLRQNPCPVLNQEFSAISKGQREAGSLPVSVDVALAAAHLMETMPFLLISNDRSQWLTFCSEDLPPLPTPPG